MDARSRTLLAAALGASAARAMFWREDRAHPCGAIGGLEFTQPAIAAQLTEARLADAARAGATSLITDDPGCLHQLQSRKAPGIAVLGLYQLLRDRLRDDWLGRDTVGRSFSSGAPWQRAPDCSSAG